METHFLVFGHSSSEFDFRYLYATCAMRAARAMNSNENVNYVDFHRVKW